MALLPCPKILVAIFLAVLSTQANATTVMATTGTVACKFKVDYVRLWQINSDGDHDTFIQAAGKKVADNLCILISKGDEVFLNGKDAASMMCVRRVGDEDCWWTGDSFKAKK
jgi:hypothetical protein